MGCNIAMYVCMYVHVWGFQLGEQKAGSMSEREGDYSELRGRDNSYCGQFHFHLRCVV